MRKIGCSDDYILRTCFHGSLTVYLFYTIRTTFMTVFQDFDIYVLSHVFRNQLFRCIFLNKNNFCVRLSLKYEPCRQTGNTHGVMSKR